MDQLLSPLPELSRTPGDQASVNPTAESASTHRAASCNQSNEATRKATSNHDPPTTRSDHDSPISDCADCDEETASTVHRPSAQRLKASQGDRTVPAEQHQGQACE